MTIAIITGGSRGLGKSTALHLADRGVDIILTYNSKQAEGDKVVKEITAKGRKAIALQLDVTNSASFPGFVTAVKQALQSNWRRVDFDFLVNNAGSGIHASFMEITEEQFEDLEPC